MKSPTLDQAIERLAIEWHVVQASQTKKTREYRNASFSGSISFASALFDRPQLELIEAAIARSKEHDG